MALVPFEVTNEVGPRACVVRVGGDIDISVVPELREALEVSLTSGCSNIVLDLSDVTYADSSALGLLVWLDHRLGPQDGRLVLAGANPDVARILELSGLVSVARTVAMSDDVSTALEGLDLPPAATEALWEREVEVPAVLNDLGAVRESVAAMIAPLGFQDSALFDIKVALGEALANAVRHGSPVGGEPLVGVKVQAYSDRVVIEVTDSGHGFDGTPRESDDLYAPNGRGIMFMRALTDRVEFDRSPRGGTLVRLVKHRAGER